MEKVPTTSLSNASTNFYPADSTRSDLRRPAPSLQVVVLDEIKKDEEKMSR
jgi:hypothetical protein